ncbi:hypothetical protein [Mobilicoccus pelagius]|uniref:Uncharacterized protein n=1 Tax=Mobilicoccus pelagius NBRC 104925 TaxID=1089455 RepID=H5UVW0_9MICO|nr:hypothetical protein [Mobilicoccus pelagius]GAB49868.1 hypothetical protein MOPEL_135_01060 [Mobilicoccus pelagius NBRC 104925]
MSNVGTAGATAPAPRPGRGAPTAATAPASSAVWRPTSQPSAQEVATAEAAGTPTPQAWRRGSLARGLRKLTAAGVLACSINGLAAYAVVTTDAARVQSVAATQAAEIGAVTSTIDTLGTTAKVTPVGAAKEKAYLTTVSEASSRLASVTARAATGPAGLAEDTVALQGLSADYTRYVALLESGRAATGKVAADRYGQAETLRTTRLDPALAELQRQNTDRSTEAKTLAWVTMGGLGLTSLVTLLTLLGGSRWLASRTKRVVNPGLFGALVMSAAVSGYAFSQLGSATIVAPGAGPLLLVGGLAAAGLVWLGLDQRLKEYR